MAKVGSINEKQRGNRRESRPVAEGCMKNHETGKQQWQSSAIAATYSPAASRALLVIGHEAKFTGNTGSELRDQQTFQIRWSAEAEWQNPFRWVWDRVDFITQKTINATRGAILSFGAKHPTGTQQWTIHALSQGTHFWLKTLQLTTGKIIQSWHPKDFM